MDQPKPKVSSKKVKQPKKDISLDLDNGYKVDGRWTVQKKLGQGSFGAVYECVDNEAKVPGTMALKLESRKIKNQVLKVEVAVLQAMKECSHACKLLSRGRTEDYNFMVMSVLGSSLKDLRKKQPNSKFCLSTSTRVIYQCIQALEDMHNVDWIHRDVKPANYAIGGNSETQKTVYIFDFGLSRRYRKKNCELKCGRLDVKFRGTKKYCSVNAHKKVELGRHDDLISLLYMMVEFVKGDFTLPWGKEKENEDFINSKEANVNNIYQDLPSIFLQGHTYLHSLNYNDTPNYDMLKGPLLKLITDMKFDGDPFDWEKIPMKDLPSCYSMAPEESFNKASKSNVDTPPINKDEKVDIEEVPDLPDCINKPNLPQT